MFEQCKIIFKKKGKCGDLKKKTFFKILVFSILKNVFNLKRGFEKL
jgi:hypothetical protein